MQGRTKESLAVINFLQRVYSNFRRSEIYSSFHRTSIQDYAKDGARNFLPRYITFELFIVNYSIGIRLQNEMHLGKIFLAAFSVRFYA